ncbi:hypothetical protein Tco_0316894 [Tanacetum coccineum]
MHSRDERRTSQNSGICSPGGKDREIYVRRQPHWKVVEHVNHKKFSEGGVIVVKEDPDVIHFDNSSDLPLSTSLNDLDNATLHIDGQSMEVDAPPDIIDLDEDDDIIDDEDALPHDLADSDDEDLVNVDGDDGVDVMSADVAQGHGDDGGGDDHPLTHHIPTDCGGCFVNRGKGTRKPNLGGRKAVRLHTRQETRNLRLKKITDDKGPGDDFVLPFLAKGPGRAEGGDRDKDWDAVCLEASHVIPTLDRYQCGHPTTFAKVIGMPRLPFRMIPGTKPEPLKIAKTGQRARLYAGRDPGHLLTFEIRCSATREYPSLIHTFFVTHTVNGVFTRDEDRAIYEEMLRLQALGSNTLSGVPYTEVEINALARKGKQRGHLPCVDRVLLGRATVVLSPPRPQCTHNSADVEKLKKKNKYLTKQVNLMMKLFRSDDKFSQMLIQYESTPEFGNASGSGRCEDDEMADDKDDDEDKEDEEDGEVLEFFSTFRFEETILDLNTVGALQFQLGGDKHRMSWREFILVIGLHTTEEMKSTRFGTYWAESDRLIACNITRRSQAPEKVIVTDWFNFVAWMLIQSTSLIFWLGINGDSLRPPYAVAGAPKVANGAPDVDEGAQAVPAPIQAP